jgi:hypothetical protein
MIGYQIVMANSQMATTLMSDMLRGIRDSFLGRSLSVVISIFKSALLEQNGAENVI